MYFEPLISVKCCPKLHIKQLRNNLHYINCLKLHVLYCTPTVRSGWVGEGAFTDEKRGGGVQEKGRSGPPDPPPSGHAYEASISVTKFEI